MEMAEVLGTARDSLTFSELMRRSGTRSFRVMKDQVVTTTWKGNGLDREVGVGRERLRRPRLRLRLRRYTIAPIDVGILYQQVCALRKGRQR